MLVNKTTSSFINIFVSFSNTTNGYNNSILQIYVGEAEKGKQIIQEAALLQHIKRLNKMPVVIKTNNDDISKSCKLVTLNKTKTFD